MPRHGFVLALASTLTLFALPAMGDEIPRAIEGRWAPAGQCGERESVIRFDEQTLQWGTQAAEGAEYYADDSPAGNGAVHWAEEGNVSNFEYDAERGVLLFNEQGYGMGVAPVVYEKCGLFDR